MATHTIVDSRNGRTITLESSATTLGELKAELADAGINTTGMMIQEGLTKTTLLTDDSLLPTNVIYHGRETNNLVFRISGNTNKIKSGSDLNTTLEQAIRDIVRDELSKTPSVPSPYSAEEVKSFFDQIDNKESDEDNEDDEEF